MTREEFLHAKWQYGMVVKVTNDPIHDEELEVIGVDFINDVVTVAFDNSASITLHYTDLEIPPDAFMFD